MSKLLPGEIRMSEPYEHHLPSPTELQPFAFICEADPKRFAVQVSGACRFGYDFHGTMFIDHQGRYCQAMVLPSRSQTSAPGNTDQTPRLCLCGQVS